MSIFNRKQPRGNEYEREVAALTQKKEKEASRRSPGGFNFTEEDSGLNRIRIQDEAAQNVNRRFENKYNKLLESSKAGYFAPYDPGNKVKPVKGRAPMRQEWGGDEGGYSWEYRGRRNDGGEEYQYYEKERQAIIAKQKAFDDNALASQNFAAGRNKQASTFLGQQDEGIVDSPFKRRGRKLGGKTLLGSDDQLGA